MAFAAGRYWTSAPESHYNVSIKSKTDTDASVRLSNNCRHREAFLSSRYKGVYMRKFRKITIGGIESKIFTLILVTVILLSVAFLAVSLYRSSMLTNLTAETSARQQETTSAIISGTMDQVMDSTMKNSSEMEAIIVDEMFSAAQSRVILVADYATKMFSDPGSFPAKPYAGPDPSQGGKIVPQVIWADGVDPQDPAIAEQAGMLANLSETMVSMCKATGTDNIYIGTGEGVFLTVSSSSADWFEKDGTLKHYDCRSRFWYKQAAEAGGVVFSDLEVDATTGEMSVVCAMPVYGPDGNLASVVGADLFLHAMENVVAKFASDGGYSWIVNRDGHVIYSPNPEVLRMNTSANAVDLRDSENQQLAALTADAMAEGTDVRIVNVQGKDYYMLGMPIKTVGWTLFTAFPKETVDQVGVTQLNSYDGIMNDARSTYQDKITETSHSTQILLALLALAAVTAAVILGKRIVKPLNTITEQVTSLNEQDPVFKMQDAYRTGDEIEVLAESFADLSQKTVNYVEEVRRVTAEKERIGTELHTARQIQEGMLPNIFPAFPDRPEFDLYASMDPAKEVGGDFYDFFLIDNDHLALVMADVSGKGIPGALFMMASKNILQSNAMQGGSPADILERMNKIICANNPMQMFVTVWLGILEISTGRLIASNAGHEYPMIRRTSGVFEIFKDKHGFVVGGMEGMKYTAYELQLHPGDMLFLYTDGVPEATNTKNELFGTDRMLSSLNGHPGDLPSTTLRHMQDAVDVFVDGAEQFDDLTMLCLEYKGPEK